MAILLLGATILAATVVLAAHTTDGSWVNFMESGAANDEPVTQVEDEVISRSPQPSTIQKSEKEERIVAIANRRRVREEVLRYM